MSTLKPGDWTCPDCGHHCFASRSECPKCKKWRPKHRAGDWICNTCKELNFSGRNKCRKCNATKSMPSTDSQPLQPGDWLCQCKEMNFGSRLQCRKCGNNRPNVSSESDNDDNNKCQVCFDREKDVKLPCNHVGICMVCATASNKCPFCRAPYAEDQIEKVYVM